MLQIYQYMYHALAFFMLIVDSGTFYRMPRVIVEPKLRQICLMPGSNVTITCTLYSNTSTSLFTTDFTNWSLVWYHNGEQLRNSTIIHQGNNSIASVTQVATAGMFSCIVSKFTPIQRFGNHSVFVRMRPKPVTKLTATPKFVSDEDGFSRFVVVSWLRQSNENVYSLLFKINSEACSFPFSCPEGDIKATCIGMKCTAYIDTDGYDMSVLFFHIVTQQGGCEANSEVWKYNLTLTECDGLLPPKTLFYVPFKPTKLEIKLAHRRVTLKWQDLILGYLPPSVLLTYNCSTNNHTLGRTFDNVGIRIIHLADKDIRGYVPYGECTFCLAVQEYRCGKYSEPFCKTTRLHEELPSQAPSITCSYDTCATTTDAHFRNVTVTWTMPPEESLRGDLKEVKITCREFSSNLTWREMNVTNLTSNSVVVEDLNKTLNYTCHLQVCNGVGCSGYSDPLHLFGLKKRPKSLPADDSSSISTKYIIIAVVVGVFIVVLAFSLRFCFKRLSRRSSSNLPSLSPTPDNPYYNRISDEEQYDKLDNTITKDDLTCDGIHRPKVSFV